MVGYHGISAEWGREWGVVGRVMFRGFACVWVIMGYRGIFIASLTHSYILRTFLFEAKALPLISMWLIILGRITESNMRIWTPCLLLFLVWIEKQYFC